MLTLEVRSEFLNPLQNFVNTDWEFCHKKSEIKYCFIYGCVKNTGKTLWRVLSIYLDAICLCSWVCLWQLNFLIFFFFKSCLYSGPIETSFLDKCREHHNLTRVNPDNHICRKIIVFKGKSCMPLLSFSF